MDEIKKLFKTRDSAVSKKDKKLFLSTQIGEIRGSFAEGYLSIDKLVTGVVAVEDINKISKMVAVRESYYIKDKKNHSSLLLYYLIKTVNGWRIDNIIY